MLAQISARGSLVSLPLLKVTTRLSVLSYHERISSRGFNWGANDEMLAYSSARVKTTVLTNAMLLLGPRLEKLCAVANDNLIVQVSLDGGRPEDHDDQ